MRLFAIRDYRNLFLAQVIALFGTGLATVALGLLAYRFAGAAAGAVLATALTIKMVLYVTIAPIAAAFADRIPRRAFLVALDIVRALVVLALPFVTEVWQVYVLVAVLQSASAAFTPTFQAVIPDIVPDRTLYTKALSASQVAYTMESLLSPVLAAVALAFVDFSWLFVGTAIGFVVSAVLVLSTRIPDAVATGDRGVWRRITAGLRAFGASSRLRGLIALNLVEAAVGAIVIVSTVTVVRDVLRGTETDVAWALAVSGGGTLLAALVVPWLLGRLSERTVMLAGAFALVGAAVGAVAAAGVLTWALLVPLWFTVGVGLALVATPRGRVIREAVRDDQVPAAFAAQFSLSHAAWLLTYPVAGFVATAAGFTAAWTILAGLAVVAAIAAALLWPRVERSQARPRVA